VQLFELIPLLKVVLKGKCCFRCYKLCGASQAWVDHVTSSDTAQTCVRVESVQ
jgi:hypothetical protein